VTKILFERTQFSVGGPPRATMPGLKLAAEKLSDECAPKFPGRVFNRRIFLFLPAMARFSVGGTRDPVAGHESRVDVEVRSPPFVRDVRVAVPCGC